MRRVRGFLPVLLLAAPLAAQAQARARPTSTPKEPRAPDRRASWRAEHSGRRNSLPQGLDPPCDRIAPHHGAARPRETPKRTIANRPILNLEARPEGDIWGP
jgi:hypothetical protein